MITPEQFSTLTCYNSTISKFYSLPKIHKPTLSFIPIIASIDAPTQNLSILITSILTQAYDFDNPHYIRDSFQFASRFNDFQLPDNYVLVSLDVVSLFTNVPLQLCIEVLTKKWNIINQCCNLTFNAFIDIVSFIFNIFFSSLTTVYTDRFWALRREGISLPSSPYTSWMSWSPHV